MWKLRPKTEELEEDLTEKLKIKLSCITYEYDHDRSKQNGNKIIILDNTINSHHKISIKIQMNILMLLVEKP